MPRPTSSTTIQRPDLGALAYEYYLEADQRGFIGLKLMPIFEVAEQSADYPKIPLEALLKMPNLKRAPRGNYARSDWEFETGTYKAEEYGWEEPIDDVEAALYARFFDAETVANMRAVDILLRAQEQRVASLLFNTSNITGTTNVGTEWSTVATCTPLADVEAGKTAIKAASGLVPNVIAMSDKVFGNVTRSKEILDAFRYTNPVESGNREVKRALLAQYFGVDEVLVGGAIKDTKKKGTATTIGDIWDDEYVLLAKISNGGPDLRDPCLGRSFLWTADSPQNLVVESYREEKIRSNVIRVRHNVDEALVFAGAGYLLGNITA
jgi:hypothetical protein